MALQPEGAGEEERANLVISDPIPGESDSTTVEIVLSKEAKGGFVPSLLVIRLALWGLILGVFTFGQRPLAQLLGRIFVGLHAARGGTTYRRLDGAPPEAAGTAWEPAQAALEQAGFRQAFDYDVLNVGFPNCARLLDREGVVQALLQYAFVQEAHLHYVEMQTHFTDGSTVTTSTSPYAGNLKRPERHGLVQLPQGTAPTEVLRRHEAGLEARVNQGQSVSRLDLDTMFDAWKRIEVECLSGVQGAPLTEQGLERVTARGSQASPPPVPEEPTVSEAPAAPPADDRGTFADQVATKLREANPRLEVARKDTLILTVRSGASEADLDLETVYFLWRNNPNDREKILAGFLARYAPRG